jgi:DNA repair exonuclease SbcCD ATPase subunit
MDIAQLAQMVNWLDEEHRRDRAEIARLQQRIEAQSADIIEQARRIQELEGRLAATQAHLTRFNQLEQAIQNAKTELVTLVDRGDEGRVQAQRELERARLSDREMLSREISEVRRELPRISRLEETVEIRAIEDERLSELIMGVRNQIGGLAKEIEERTRQIPFLAEQRTSDTKRIAQLQQETVELFKRTEATSGRLPLLEEGIRKTMAEVEKYPPILDNLRDQQIQFMERMRATVVDREQVLTRWKETIEEQKTIVNQAYERVQNFAQQIDISRRAVQEMQEFKDMILREQAQVQELQRLAEERMRREMDEFREDYEKKRRKTELRQEHLWSEQDKYNREVIERFPPIHHDLKIHEHLVQQLWKLQESYGHYFLGTAQAWLDGMQGALRSRDEQIKQMEEDWQRQRRNQELYANQNLNPRRTAGIMTSEPPETVITNGNRR